MGNFLIRTVIATGAMVLSGAATHKGIQFLNAPLDKSITPEQQRTYVVQHNRDENIQRRINEQFANAKAHVEKSVAESKDKTDELTIIVPFKIDFAKASADANQSYDRQQKFTPAFEVGLSSLSGFFVGVYVFSRLGRVSDAAVARSDNRPAAEL